MRLPTLLVYTVFFMFCQQNCLTVVAQGPGGGPAAPALDEPNFRERVWASGGPRLTGLHNGKLVKQIIISGNETISETKILSHMQTRPDRVFDDKQLQSDIMSLYSTDLFRNIRVSQPVEQPGGVIVKLHVVEQPTVTEIVFHGARRLDSSMLNKHCGIAVGDPANPYSVEMAKQRIEDLYHEKGMNQAAVDIIRGSRPGDRSIFFEISEGPVERIWDLHFQGNVKFSDDVLKTKVKSKDSRLLGVGAYLGNVANDIQIEDDKQLLVAFYRSLGYFNARVDYRKEYYQRGDFIKLTFVVDEGEQFVVRNIAIKGNEYPIFTDELLMKDMELKPGEAFNLGKMNRDQRRIRNEFYGRVGFVFVDVQPKPVFLEEPNQLDLYYVIDEGEQYRVGDLNVHIEGDSGHTKESVVLALLGLREGQLIDLRELENAERRLRASNIFESNPALGNPPSIKVRGSSANDFR